MSSVIGNGFLIPLFMKGNNMKRLTLSLILFSSIFFATNLSAQTTEERFHDLFVTAGYATAFGAALGAACLSFTPDPSSELRFVAIGASLGFIGGSIMGSYIIFSPMMSWETQQKPEDHLMAYNSREKADRNRFELQPTSLPEHTLVVKPNYNMTSKRLSSIEGSITLLRF